MAKANDDEWHSKLPASLIPETFNSTKKSNKFETFAEEYVHTTLLSKAQNPALQFGTKVKDKVLLLDEPIPNYKLNKEKAEGKAMRRRKKTLSLREQKALGLHIIPLEYQKWDQYTMLHECWLEYMNNVMADASADDVIYARLVKADFHGAILTGRYFLQVVKSKCPSNIGISGIVLKDTEQTFVLITKDDQLKTIPKNNNVFAMEIDQKLVTIYGSQFRHRPADRASKKLKIRASIDL